MRQKRGVFVFFCDDIRYEVGNKHSLIGCYANELIVEATPVVLPKLCAKVRVFTPTDHPIERLRLRVLVDGEVTAEMVIDEERLELAHKEFIASGRDAGAYIGIDAHMSLSPFSIEKPCTLHIEAETEDGTTRSGAFGIREHK